MNKFTQQDWNIYNEIYSYENLVKDMEKCLSYLGEDPLFIIPNFAVSSTGTRLASVVVITDTFLAEVTTGSNKIYKFDVIKKSHFFNFRIERQQQLIAIGGPSDVISVEIRHTNSFSTKLNFVGNNAHMESWLANIIRAFPASSIND